MKRMLGCLLAMLMLLLIPALASALEVAQHSNEVVCVSNDYQDALNFAIVGPVDFGLCLSTFCYASNDNVLPLPIIRVFNDHTRQCVAMGNIVTNRNLQPMKARARSCVIDA